MIATDVHSELVGPAQSVWTFVRSPASQRAAIWSPARP